MNKALGLWNSEITMLPQQPIPETIENLSTLTEPGNEPETATHSTTIVVKFYIQCRIITNFMKVEENESPHLEKNHSKM